MASVKSSDSEDAPLEELKGLVPMPDSGRDMEPTSNPERGPGEKMLKPKPDRIQINLEKTSKNGQYQIHLEDPELRRLLLQGFETDQAGNLKPKPPLLATTILKKQFTAFDRNRKQPDGELPSFHGFFTLFWMSVALMLIRIAANNWRRSGSIFGDNALMRLMFGTDVVLLGIIDCLMMSSAMLVSLAIQLLCFNHWISWSRTGWLLQSLWQLVFLTGFIAFCRIRWPDIWTHCVFITLHTITILMKQHSYAFYNGHLSEIYKKKAILEQKLALLDEADEASSPSSSTASHATSYFDQAQLSQLSHRKHHVSGANTPTDPDISRVAAAIVSEETLSAQQVKSLRKLIRWEISSCAAKLRGTCKTTQNYYPLNLTVSDSLSYIPLPTLIYELEYPRQPSISWTYVLEKSLATFGVLLVMIIVSEAHIYPIVTSIHALKTTHTLLDRLFEFPWAFSDLLFPMMLEYLLSWYIIWECVLNLLAELTLFSSRGFYSAWWNSTSWDQFARDWNQPVHEFLLRFAYRSSITSWNLSKSTATLLTFLLSASVHELVMAVIFGKIRGYLLAMQMLQLPMVMLSRTKFLRGRDVLGNVFFWTGIFVGPSFLCTLYLFL